MIVHFNQPYFAGEEVQNIINCVLTGHISGDGTYTRKSQLFFEETYNFNKVLLTSSCTDALEMAAILCNLKQGDEVIMPSFTHVSTANAFALRGARIRFADVDEDVPNISLEEIEKLINADTKAIVVVHYSGIAVDMDALMAIANEHNLFVIEDAAHAIDATYKGKSLGSIGHYGAMSFHETKNITCGEGGALFVNQPDAAKRAEIIWEKGTNRVAFHRGEVDKYEWVDLGSSYLPSDITASILFSQLNKLEEIQKKRVAIWERYYDGLKNLQESGKLKLANIPDYASNNGHIFFLVTDNLEQRNKLMFHLAMNEVQAVFHYLPLHSSKYFMDKHENGVLKNTDMFANQLLRLPFWTALKQDQIDYVIDKIQDFYK